MTMGAQSVTSNTHLAAVLRASGSAKAIGQQIGKSHRTVERWMRGDGKPSPLIIIQLLRVNDAFAAALLRVAGWAEAARAINEAANARKQIELDATWARMDRAPPPRR